MLSDESVCIWRGSSYKTLYVGANVAYLDGVVFNTSSCMTYKEKHTSSVSTEMTLDSESTYIALLCGPMVK